MFADMTNEEAATGQKEFGRGRRGAKIQNSGGARLPMEDNRLTELLIFSC